MGRAHPLTAGIEQDARQQAGLFVGQAERSLDAVVGQDRLDLAPKRPIDDRLLLAGIALVLVHDSHHGRSGSAA